MQATRKKIDIVSLKMVRDKTIEYSTNMITSPRSAADFLRPLIEDSDREQMVVVALDTKHKPTAIQFISTGTLNASLVHPREVFKMSILANACSILLGHNHPSGLVEPSQQDDEITERLKEAGELIGIDLLDHIIIGDQSYYSYKEQG